MLEVILIFQVRANGSLDYEGSSEYEENYIDNAMYFRARPNLVGSRIGAVLQERLEVKGKNYSWKLVAIYLDKKVVLYI